MTQRRNSRSSTGVERSLLQESLSGRVSYGSTRHNRHQAQPHQPALETIPGSDADSDIPNEDQYVSDGYSVSIPSSDAHSVGSFDTYDDMGVSVATELKSIIKSSVPLSITFFLEYLLAINSLFLIGHLGSIELASASLAVMTFNITGMAVYEGMSSCLDTFCSQAFGAKKFDKVGLYFQRCTAMILAVSIPISFFWWYSKFFLDLIIPEKQLLDLTQLYLRVFCFGSPGLILFETGKRYLQAQKIFHASTYVLFICVPINLLLNFTFIRLWGFIGAPIAIASTYWLMSSMLLAYVVSVDGKQCWNGFSSRSFRHWRPMLKLAVPGLVMIESEYLSFEILTVMASYFGTESLAAQSIVSNTGSLIYQFPFAVGCAISTRVAIYIGSGSIKSSKTAATISFGVAMVTGLLTCTGIILLRRPLTLLFTSDPVVIDLSLKAMPILAMNQLFDTFNIISAAILRSQGRQEIGSYLNIFSYYIIALPLAYLLAFKLDLGINGLWLGLGTGICVLATSEVICVINSNWKQIVIDAANRDDDEPDVLIEDSSAASSIYSAPY